MHDFNGGILPSGLFWTVQLPDDALEVSKDRTRATLTARNVPVIDTFQFLGASDTPARVSFTVRWTASGEVQELGSGTAVELTDPAAFLGKFAPALARGSISGSEIGFSFTSDRGVSSREGYAEMGRERNGAFLESAAR